MDIAHILFRFYSEAGFYPQYHCKSSVTVAECRVVNAQWSDQGS